jgi:antitoxin component YwqK of YwqJK toxin-antitoxin module
MKNLLTILFLVLLTFESFSQNDTVHLFHNHILYRGQQFNRIINGVKQGMWIEYTIDDSPDYYILGSGLDLKSGQEVHFQNDIQIQYRPHKPSEKEGERIILDKSIDTTSVGIIYSASVLEIHNKVPANQFHITARGKYINDKKNGRWMYYYIAGNIRKEIEYLDGLPATGFKIFRENGNLMFDVIRINYADWKICRYSETGKLIDCELKFIDEFRDLF